MKKIPMRTCVVTNEKLPKKELIRIVKTKDGEVLVDPSGKINGRGVYLKKDMNVFDIAKDKKILNKKLEIDIPEELFEELKKVVSD
ncbi:MAG: YlxR family protein [bacterium]|nr:YlxR family protein [bacterium]